MSEQLPNLADLSHAEKDDMGILTGIQSTFTDTPILPQDILIAE